MEFHSVFLGFCAVFYLGSTASVMDTALRQTIPGSSNAIYAIANEGRRLIDCDRTSVAIGTGRNCRVKAVSGLDSIERRAEQVKNLGSLASTVIRAGQPLWYAGEDADLPPQIEKRMHAYVDKSHTKMLAILPLFETVPETDGDRCRCSRSTADPIQVDRW